MLYLKNSIIWYGGKKNTKAKNILLVKVFRKDAKAKKPVIKIPKCTIDSAISARIEKSTQIW